MTPTTANSWSQQVGATPGKLALIGVLAVILAYVVLSQVMGGRKAPSRAAQPAIAEPGALHDTASGSSTARRPASVRHQQPWPEPDLPAVVSYDPFAIPRWARPAMMTVASDGTVSPTATGGGSEQVLAKLRQLGAAVIVEVDGEPLALVGEHQVRVGDRLEGFRVTKITESGIVLASEGQSP